jgi:uncharacterized membrane protein (DUF485 family)
LSYENGKIGAAHFALAAQNAVFFIVYFYFVKLINSQNFLRAKLYADTASFATIGMYCQAHILFHLFRVSLRWSAKQATVSGFTGLLGFLPGF